MKGFGFYLVIFPDHLEQDPMQISYNTDMTKI